MKKNIAIAALASVIFAFTQSAACAQQAPQSKSEEPVGEFSGFGVKVSRGNYYFAKSAIMVFGTQWGSAVQTPEELDQRTWEDLLLSYEAFRRGIKVEDKEFEEELTKMLKAEKVSFDWQKAPDAYAKWIKDKTQEPRELFENQLRHLIQLRKLRQQVMDGISPQVNEEEAFQEFLNEYNTLSVEMAQFENLEAAKSFYAKIKNKPKLWEKEIKENPRLFRKPGFVALEFLMEMWKFPKDDLYKMLGLDIGAVYPPIPIYSGKFGVCRIMEKRLADKEQFPKLKQSYYAQIEMKKKYGALAAWFQKLKDDAKIKVYKEAEIIPKAEGKDQKAP
ncbi:MAG: hypothetical protein ACM3IL_01060 [Deltaproteobacteria bacterium]